MPIVWIARLLGIPVRERVAGSDIFEELKLSSDPSSKLKVFLFGGAEGVAESACKNLNSRSSGLTCVGSLSPGFASVEADERRLDF
jgi:N-acetylglucosaminyldiphosphoundecaprenol N-acetyl-beta-D-mannosaminyltransferase